MPEIRHQSGHAVIALFFIALTMGLAIVMSFTCHSYAMIISGIEIRKNFPVFEDDLRRVITARIGEEYSPEKAEEVANRIAKVYQDEGYWDATVEHRIKEKGRGDEGFLIFIIHKGPKTRIGRIDIIDDRPGEQPDAGNFLGLMEGQVLKKQVFDDRIKELEEHLIRSGYLKADIRYLKRREDAGVRLEIYVHRGPLLDIVIEGNTAFSRERILDSMTFFENRFFDQWELNESVRRIKGLYQDDGYIDCHVENDWKEEDSFGIQGDQRVVFRIYEGERTFLKGIKFEHKGYIREKRLRRQFLSLQSLYIFRPRPYMEITFADDMEALEALYRSEGFPMVLLDVKTEKLERREIRKRIIVNEGPRLIVEQVSFSGNQAFSDGQLMGMLSITERSPLRPNLLESDRRSLGIFYGNNGYPYAQVSAHVERDETSGIARILYQIEEGPFARFGDLIIRRNLTTSERVIRLSCKFKTGDPFSYQKILDTQERLSTLGIFRSLSVEPVDLDKKPERVDCLVEVEEMDTGQFNIGGGFSSRSGYRGYIEIGEDNLAGRAKSGSFRADYAGFGRRYDLVEEIERTTKYTVTLKDPLLMPQRKIEGETKIYTSTEARREYHSRGNGLSLGIWRPYKRRMRIGLTYHIDKTRLSDVTIKREEIPEPDKELTISAIGPTVIYDSRDNFLDPHEGLYTNFTFDWAGGKIGGDQDFYKAMGEVRVFIPISSRLIMAFSVRGGYIGLHGNSSYAPIQERFFAGGINTVRGFKEDSLGPIDKGTGLPLGGCKLWINNLEFRFPLYKSIKGVIFFDAGNVWGTGDNMPVKTLREGAGLGLRWITPIGPIRLDYGRAIDRKPDEPPSRAYFSVGHAF